MRVVHDGWRTLVSALCILLLGTSTVEAINLDLTSSDSIKSAAQTLAYGMVKYYHGNETGQIPGMLPNPYYWYEAGAMFGQLINYWFYTGHTEYNDIVTQGLLFQTGPDNDYMPPNQTKVEGNDDQIFWAFAVMTAAETKFPDPPSSSPQWLALAQAVFNVQAARWDTTNCGGGLRWQIFQFNSGYNYKNSISNGGLFQISARLARYTQNQTYADWADKVYDWMHASALMSPTYHFYDGTNMENNCTAVDHREWSYNAAVWLLGAAHMANYTNNDPKWLSAVHGILNATSIFFSPQVPNVMYEATCEPTTVCDTDQRSFKACLAQSLAATSQLVPSTSSQIMPLLSTSANAAAKQCSGGTDGVTCGMHWTQANWDGLYGVGEQMSALAVVQSNLIGSVPGPVGLKSGGTSKSDPSAGTGGGGLVQGSPEKVVVVTTGDRVGAAALTVVVVVLLLAIGGWMIWVE